MAQHTGTPSRHPSGGMRGALDIAIKDLTRYSRSLFIWAMMFVAPLLIAGLIYFAFSGLGSSSGFNVPLTRVQVANLDQPTAQSGGFLVGKRLVEFLQGEGLASLVQVKVAQDEASARAAVDKRAADVAVIIPADLSTAAFLPDRKATIVLYQDPTLTIGPGIVQGLLRNYLDGFSGSKVAAGVVLQQLSERGVMADGPALQNVTLQYAAWAQRLGESQQAGDHPAIRIQSPPRKAVAANALAALAGKILAGQLIFFAFYTAAATAQSIITEEEQLTLGRLFTTPTPRTTILSGKFIGVFLLVLCQVLVLTTVSSVLFHIQWGKPLPVLMAILGLVVVTTGLGLFLMSFVKNSRQAGVMFGGVLTVLGMAGGLFAAGVESQPKAFETIALFTPHGWALRIWQLSLAGADAGEMLLPFAVLLIMGAALFTGGALAFRRRLT
jgi:ABC-type transport system involved in multi-copper enzyme maturation permease subunit